MKIKKTRIIFYTLGIFLVLFFMIYHCMVVDIAKSEIRSPLINKDIHKKNSTILNLEEINKIKLNDLKNYLYLSDISIKPDGIINLDEVDNFCKENQNNIEQVDLRKIIGNYPIKSTSVLSYDLFAINYFNILCLIKKKQYSTVKFKLQELFHLNFELSKSKSNYNEVYAFLYNKFRYNMIIKEILKDQTIEAERLVEFLSIDNDAIDFNMILLYMHYQEGYLMDSGFNDQSISSWRRIYNNNAPLTYIFQPNRTLDLSRKLIMESYIEVTSADFEMQTRYKFAQFYVEPGWAIYLRNSYGEKYAKLLGLEAFDLLKYVLKFNNDLNQYLILKKIYEHILMHKNLPDSLLSLGLEKSILTDVNTKSYYIYSKENKTFQSLGVDKINNFPKIISSHFDEDELSKYIELNSKRSHDDFLYRIKSNP